VELNGTIEIRLNQQKNGEENYNLLNFNCTQQPKIKPEQIRVVANYENSNCDEIKNSFVSTPNTLSVTISSSVNSNCNNSLSIGVIVAIVLSVFGLAVIVAVIGILIFLKRKSIFRKKIKVVDNELSKVSQQKKWVDNETSNNSSTTKWEGDKNFEDFK
jgi:hypothetical protein